MRLIQKAEVVDTENKTKFLTRFEYHIYGCETYDFVYFEVVEVERQLNIFLRCKQIRTTSHLNQNKK